MKLRMLYLCFFTAVFVVGLYPTDSPCFIAMGIIGFLATFFFLPKEKP